MPDHYSCKHMMVYYIYWFSVSHFVQILFSHILLLQIMTNLHKYLTTTLDCKFPRLIYHYNKLQFDLMSEELSLWNSSVYGHKQTIEIYTVWMLSTLPFAWLHRIAQNSWNTLRTLINCFQNSSSLRPRCCIAPSPTTLCSIHAGFLRSSRITLGTSVSSLSSLHVDKRRWLSVRSASVWVSAVLKTNTCAMRVVTVLMHVMPPRLCRTIFLYNRIQSSNSSSIMMKMVYTTPNYR